MSALTDRLQHSIHCDTMHTIYGDEYNTHVFKCTCGAEAAQAELAAIQSERAALREAAKKVLRFLPYTILNVDVIAQPDSPAQHRVVEYREAIDELAAALDGEKPWQGHVDYVKFYGHALSPEEIKKVADDDALSGEKQEK